MAKFAIFRTVDLANNPDLAKPLGYISASCRKIAYHYMTHGGKYAKHGIDNLSLVQLSAKENLTVTKAEE